MARRHREVLVKLDPLAVARYQITEKDIRAIERYLKIIQADLYEEASTWQDILDFDGPYATSIVIHEIVEIRLLLEAGINRDEDDLELFLESDLGVYILEEARIEAAQAILDRMKGEMA